MLADGLAALGVGPQQVRHPEAQHAESEQAGHAVGDQQSEQLVVVFQKAHQEIIVLSELDVTVPIRDVILIFQAQLYLDVVD